MGLSAPFRHSGSLSPASLSDYCDVWTPPLDLTYSCATERQTGRVGAAGGNRTRFPGVEVRYFTSKLLLRMVWAKGLEPPASCSQSTRSAKLSYTQINGCERLDSNQRSSAHEADEMTTSLLRNINGADDGT